MFIETFYQTGTSFLSTLKSSSGFSFVCLNMCNLEKKKAYKKDVKSTKKKQNKRRKKKPYCDIGCRKQQESFRCWVVMLEREEFGGFLTRQRPILPELTMFSSAVLAETLGSGYRGVWWSEREVRESGAVRKWKVVVAGGMQWGCEREGEKNFVLYLYLKIKNYYLKIFIEIRMGEKVH